MIPVKLNLWNRRANELGPSKEGWSTFFIL